MRVLTEQYAKDRSRDPTGAPEARAPLPLLKLVKKKMATAAGRKFRESLGPLLGQISGSATGSNRTLHTGDHYHWRI